MWKEPWLITRIDGKPKWTFLIPAIAALTTLIGGVAGAYFVQWQFNRTHEQKECEAKRLTKEFETRQEADRKQFAEKSKETQALFDTQQETLRTQFEAKADAEKLQFERKHLEDQFNDIQNRLSDENPAIRANAALRLAQFATTPSPNAEPFKYNIENYPYFPRAASQLSIAVNLEENMDVFPALINALDDLKIFASKYGGDLLDELIRNLVMANISASLKFKKSLASYIISERNDPLAEGISEKAMFERIASTASFGLDHTVACKILKDLSQRPPFLEQSIIHEIANPSLSVKGSARDALALLQDAAVRLEYTIDELSECLRQRHGPSKVSLWNTYLIGAYLVKADFRYADLRRAELQGANLRQAEFEEADLNNAVLNDAIVAKSKLNEARYVDPSWRYANFALGDFVDNELRKKLDKRFEKKETEEQTENIETVQAVVSTIETTTTTLPVMEDNVVIIGQNTQNNA